MKSEHINSLATALARAQGEIRNAAFNRVNPHFKNRYADLAAVFDAVRAPFAKNELAVSQTTQIRDGGMILRTTVMHTSGQWIASEYPLPASPRPQELGSALTYARRYSLASIAGIAADEDDDAEQAEKSSRNGKATGPISQDQLETLIVMCDEVGTDKARFCQHFKIPSMADLPAARYDEAVKALEARRAKQ